MPSRHSKNAGDRHHFSHQERQKAGLGTIKERLGADSQLPFGYCALSLQPAEDPVISPSGHLYSRESILQYLLNKSKELKQLRERYEQQQARRLAEEKLKEIEEQNKMIQSFKETADGVSSLGKREAEIVDSAFLAKRKKVIDETATEIRIEELKKVSPWIPQFTPEAKESSIPEPPKRPLSPFSQQPLRSKDLLSVNLIKEPSSEESGSVRYLCPVSRKTITSQKVYFIKSSGTLMIEQAAEELAFPTMTCPITSKPFRREDVIELARAVSGFAATGQVEAKVHRPTIT